MKPIVLNEDEYYNDPLIAICREIVQKFEQVAKNNHFYLELYVIAQQEYSYNLVMFPMDGAYTVAEIVKWLADGDLVDAIETYHNVHKSIYGIRPSMSKTDQWADITWVKAQTLACVGRQDDYQQEQEHMND